MDDDLTAQEAKFLLIVSFSGLAISLIALLKIAARKAKNYATPR